MAFSRKKTLSFLALAATVGSCCCGAPVYANPEGANIVEGSAVISTDTNDPNILNINVATDKVVIDWNSFSIAANQTVRFFQPSQSSTALNRVTGNNVSDIFGSLFANGVIFLSNPNGINIGPTANINAASFIASTLNIDKNDFMNGRYNFYKVAGKDGYIVNKGKISTNVAGGYICLLSPQIDNQYIIEANLGTVVLASGNAMTLALDDLNQISVVVSEAAQDGLVGVDGKKVAIRNSGTITADGGKVIVTAKVLNNVFDYSFNNTGIIKAASIMGHDGVVSLKAEGAPVANIGKIEAGETRVQVPDAGFINKGTITANGVSGLPNGGKVSIEATTILQQGKVSANALEQGTAGVVEIVSRDATVLDEGSSTEARAEGVVGNGGRVLVNSKKGNTEVKKNALVDVSAGTLAGNGGYADVSAAGQLAFYGILNGRAPPGYKAGTAIIDPTDAHLGAATFGSNTTVWAPNNIIIEGNITLASGVTLNLYADHQTATPYDWEDGTGAIINSGSYTISAASGATNTSLNIIASSGIGTSSNPVRTNVHSLSAETDSSGNVYITQGTTDLIIGTMFAPKGDVFLTAGGSILDDSAAVEMLTGVDTNSGVLQVPTCFFGNNVWLTAGGNIGSVGVEGSLTYGNSMVDVALRNGTLQATAGGSIYIMALGTLINGVVNPDILSSKYILNSTGVNQELGLCAYLGQLTVDQAYNGNQRIGFGSAAGNLNLNANIATSGTSIKLFVSNNVNIAASLSSSNIAGVIKVIADFDKNGVGYINQTAGTIGSGSEAMLLSAAQGINLTSTHVARLQATNTTYGDINITNTAGSLTLTTLDNSKLPLSDPYEDDTYYAIWNTGMGNVSVRATGAGADIIGSGFGSELCTIRANGNVSVTASRDIILGDGLNNKFADIYTDGGDITLTAGRDILQQGHACWIGSNKDNGTITLSAIGDISLVTVGFYLIDLAKDAGTVTVNAGGSIHDDSTAVEQTNSADNGIVIPSLIKARNINLTAGGDIGAFNNSGNSLAENVVPFIDVYLGAGNLKATAGGSLYIEDYKSTGVAFSQAQYQLNAKDPTLTDYHEVVFGNMAGGITFNSALNLSDNEHFGAVGDITVNAPVTTTAGALGFHTNGNLNINSNITLSVTQIFDGDTGKVSSPWINMEADMDRDGIGNLNIGAVTLKFIKGGDFWFYANDIGINAAAVIDAKGDGTNLDTRVELECADPLKQIFLGNGAPAGFSGLVLDQADFNTFKADRVVVGSTSDTEADISAGLLTLAPSKVTRLDIRTQGRILNASASSLLSVSDLMLQAYGWIGGDKTNLAASGIGEPLGTGMGPLKIDADVLSYVRSMYWQSSSDYIYNKMYLNEANNITLRDVNGDVVDITAGGSITAGSIFANTLISLNAGDSILDDGKQDTSNPDMTEDPTKYDNNNSGVSKIFSLKDIKLTAHNNIGSDLLNDNIVDSGYLDLFRLSGGKLEVSSTNGNAFLNLFNNNMLDSNVAVSVPDHARAVLVSSGAGYDGSVWKIDNSDWAGLHYAGMSFNKNAELILESRGSTTIETALTTNYLLKLYATNNVFIKNSVTAPSSNILIGADFGIGYLGFPRDGFGAITQTAGVVGSGSETLSLAAAQGINLTSVWVARLEDVITSSGNIYINNTGAADLTVGRGIISGSGDVMLRSAGSILDDSTTAEIFRQVDSNGDGIDDLTIPTGIYGRNITINAGGDIGAFNGNGNTLEEVGASFLDVYLGSGNLKATAGKSVNINDYKPSGINFDQTRYQLNCKDPSATDANTVIFANLAGALTINAPLNLSDSFDLAASGDININAPVTSSAGRLGFHSNGSLNVNGNITLNGGNIFDADLKAVRSLSLDLDADMNMDGVGNVNIGAVTLKITNGGDFWIPANDVVIQSSAVLDAKGNGSNTDTRIEFELTDHSKDFFLGDGVPAGFSGLVLDQGEFNTFRADMVRVGDSSADMGNIKVGTLTLDPLKVGTLDLRTVGRILNNSASSLLSVHELRLTAHGWINGNSANPASSAIGEPSGTGQGPLKINVDSLGYAEGSYWKSSTEIYPNKLYISEVDDIELLHIYADVVVVTAGGSIVAGSLQGTTSLDLVAGNAILDDGKQEWSWPYTPLAEDPNNYSNWYGGFSRIGSPNIRLTAQNNIGSDALNDNLLDAGYLDVGRQTGGVFEATSASGSIFLNLVNSDPSLDNKTSLFVPDHERVVLAYSGDAYFDGSVWKNRVDPNLGLNTQGMNFNKNADLILISRNGLRINVPVITNAALKLYATDGVYFNNGNTVASSIDIVADAGIGYLGVASDGVGAINQYAGTISTLAGGNIFLAGAGASTIQNISAAGALTLAKTTVPATYNIGSYTLSAGGNLTINTGVTLAASGATTINVGGDWLNAGAFNSGASTVTFNGTTAGRQIVTGGTAYPFYNLSFMGSGGQWSLQQDMMVANQFKVTNGKFTSGAHSVYLQGTGATYKSTDVNSANTDWTNGSLVMLSNISQTLPDAEVYNNILLDRYTKDFSWGPPTTYYTMGILSSINGDGTISSNARVALTASAAGVNKVYDGNTNATVTLTTNNIFTKYVITPITYTASFSDSNAGTGKTVNVSAIALNGADAGKFVLTSTLATTTADITPVLLSTLTVTGIIANNKIYDGTTAVTLNTSAAALAGVIGSDNVTLGTAGAAGYFADKNVGMAKTVTVTGLTIGGSAAANYALVQPTLTANITPRTLTVTPNALNKAYDGNALAEGSLADNRIAGDVLSAEITSALFSDKNAGNGKVVTVTGLSITGKDAGNYTLASTTAITTANITPRTLTVTATGVNKAYDGAAAATVTLADNRLAGDALTDSYAGASFSDKNVANGKAVSVTGIGITGTDAGNYALASTSAVTTANITPRALTVTATGVNKTYDGTAAATAALLDNRVAGDVVTDSYTSASFGDKNVANGKTVNVTGIGITGTDAGNYALTNTTATTTANITPRPLTVTATGMNKTYDGTASAAILLSDNKVAGDIVTDSYTAALFNNKNAANGKPVSVSGLGIMGADAGNYVLASSTATTTANITPKALTISAIGVNKVYDGTASASVMLQDNRLSGDALTYGYTGALFADKNVANAKTVSVGGLEITGMDAGNYTLTNTTATTTANITLRPLTVTATGVNRTYDGTTAATVNLLDNRVAGDVLTDSYTTASFGDKNVGNGKAVSVTGIGITGTDAGNYALLNTSATTTANITPRPLTVTATGVNKAYDGAAAATVTLADNRLAGDVLTDSYTTASFGDKNVGNGKAVSVTGIGITGTDAGNYALVNTTAAATASITPRLLTVTATGVNKTYDGTTAATATLADNRLAGDVLTDSYTSAAFADKNVANGKAVSVSGIGITGTDAGNYALVSITAATTANITPKNLTVTAAGVNKTYDGTATATATLSDNRVAGDVLTDNYTAASFSDKNAANGKAVSVSGIGITGTDAGNYALANTTATTTANITPKDLIVTAAGVNKTYDGTMAAAATLSDNRLAGDVLTGGYTSAAFGDKNVANGKAVNVTGIGITGTDAGNYALANTTAIATANITPRPLTVTATGVNKTYDGTTAATATLADNRLAGDVLTDSHTGASFGDKNVANGKAVNVTGIGITGTDAGNYALASTTATTTANITPKTLTVNGVTANDKTYDGTLAAEINVAAAALVGAAAGDDIGLSKVLATGMFDSKNAGTAKPVAVSGLTLTGLDAGNYTINATAATTANVTPRPLTVAATGVNKAYDGTAAAAATLSDNRLAGDVLTDSYTSASFADKNVANSKAVSVSGIGITGSDAGNYALAGTTANTTANITPRPLTVTATGVAKEYDGTATAAVTLADNRIASDVLADSYTSASFADKNVANGKAVSVSGIGITGTDAGNYALANTSATTAANITPKTLTVNGVAANDKTYDGTVAAEINVAAVTLAGAVAGDDLGLSKALATGMFDSKNAGVAKPVAVSGLTLTGLDAGNYTINATAATTANITPRPLTVTATGVNKTYDGTIAATATLWDNRVAGDVLTDSYTAASFSDKNAANGKAVNVTGIGITGTDAGNYALANTTATTAANITPRPLTVRATVVNKTYDGTVAAAAALSDNRLAGDVLTDSYTAASFSDKNAATGKAVSVTGISITGRDAGNYALASTTSNTKANITPRPLLVTATGVNKIYDGTMAAAATLTDNRLAGDVLADNYTSASFADKTVANGKAISVTGIGITGIDAGNYALASTTAGTKANITPRPLTVTATGVNKTYDGTTSATAVLLDNRVAGDVLADNYTGASFADKNAAKGKAISVAGIGITGMDAGNYALANTTATATANITPKSLAVNGVTANDKIYDGTAAAEINVSAAALTGVIAGDDVVLDSGLAVGSFDNKNAAAVKPVAVSGLILTGGDAGNYTVDGSLATTARVAPRSLHVTATGLNKVYDGTANASVTLSDDKVAGDVFVYHYTAGSSDKNVADGKIVDVAGIGITGLDAGNYVLANTTATTAADITAKALTVSGITAFNKLEDGTKAATLDVTGALLVGVEGKDDVLLDTGAAAGVFSDAAAGTGKVVTVSGLSISGSDAGNYRVIQPTAIADVSASAPSSTSANTLAQLSTFETLWLQLPGFAELGRYQVNTFTPFRGAVYFYHPLVFIDMSAYDHFGLEEGAYEFINNKINILDRRPFSPFMH